MKTWQFLHDKLAASIDVILLYVLESKGSSPGRQGFKMAVAADNDFSGTIGGGIMEHKFVEMARAKLQQEIVLSIIYKQVHDKTVTKNQSGMICSGEQTVFFYKVQQKDIEQIEGLIHSLEAHKNGTLQLSPAGISFSPDIPGNDLYFEQYDADDFLLIEKTGFKNRLHIIGGGHCALALSKLMNGMDFYITLYEERDGLNTLEQNMYAHEKKIVASYNDLNELIEEGENVYVVIMTFGYRTDDIALKAIWNKHFKYIGVLGSRSKMEKMFSAYKRENMNEELLKNIHSPIGMQIKSQTAEEIAVSIAAEIISVKNNV